MNAIPQSPLYRSQPRFNRSHQAIEQKTDNADGQNAQQNMRVHQTVVFLPEETADARGSGEHLAGYNHQPGNPQTEAKPGEDMRKRRRKKYFRKGLQRREPQNLGDVPIVGWDGAYSLHGVDDRGPHAAEANG